MSSVERNHDVDSLSVVVGTVVGAAVVTGPTVKVTQVSRLNYCISQRTRLTISYKYLNQYIYIQTYNSTNRQLYSSENYTDNCTMSMQTQTNTTSPAYYKL